MIPCSERPAGTGRTRPVNVGPCSSRWSRRGGETLTVACAVALGNTGGHPVSPWPEAGREGVWLCDRVGGEGRQAAGGAGVGELPPGCSGCYAPAASMLSRVRTGPRG